MIYISASQVVVGLTSTQVLSPSTNITTGYVELTNDGVEKVYLAFWIDAVIGQWTVLRPWDSYSLYLSRSLDKLFLRAWITAIANASTNLALTIHNNTN